MRKLKRDLTAQRFGKLTVLEMLPNYNGTKKVYCRCSCDCGNEVIKRSDNIFETMKKGLTPSCGCISNVPKERQSKRKDYTGQKFGHLVVEEMLYGYGKHGESFCRCRCECGNEIIKDTYGLVHFDGNPPHCGCMTEHYKEMQSSKCWKDISGQRFGRLLVLETIHEFKHKSTARCKCDCGNEIIVPLTYLTSGDTRSCGCLQRDQVTITNTKDFSGIVSNYGVAILSQAYQNRKGVWLWNCRCGSCGREFVAMPAKILNGHTTSCGCEKRSSRERLIYKLLSDNGIEFIAEYSFEECKSVKPLRFDFFIPSKNTVIEYQGEQHYRPVPIFGGEEEYMTRVRNDNIKKEFCSKNGINLLELPYSMSDKQIKEKLANILNP